MNSVAGELRKFIINQDDRKKRRHNFEIWEQRWIMYLQDEVTITQEQFLNQMDIIRSHIKQRIAQEIMETNECFNMKMFKYADEPMATSRLEMQLIRAKPVPFDEIMGAKRNYE